MSGNYDPASMARARQFAQRTEANATPTNIFTVNNEAAKATVKNVNFPVKMGTSDLEDKKYALMQKLVGANGVVAGVGQNIVGDEFFNYMDRKMNNAQDVAFKAFLMKQVDWSRPESQEYWINMFPWMLEERLAEVNRVCDLQKQKAKIEVAGPSTPEDWEFIFNEQRGLIKVPDQPVHKLPEAYGAAGGYTAGDLYSRGMFSPMVHYIPPYVDGSARNTAAYQPVNTITWDDPFGNGRNEGGKLGIPQGISGYVPLARQGFGQ